MVLVAKAAQPLEARAKAIAEATPRTAIQALLRNLMPVRPVATRPAKLDTPDVFQVMPKAERQPAKFQAFGRKRRAVSRVQRYELTGKRDVSRLGTFRNYMLTTIILAHTEVTAARAAHMASGMFADQTINFVWAEKEGYIRFL